MAYTTSAEENNIIDGCLSNQRQAQRALYDRYKAAMYTLAYRITGDFHEANDVLQEAFIQVFRGLPGFKKKSTLGAWIKTIVVRTAIKKARKMVRHDSIDNLGDNNPIDWGDYLDAEYLEQAIQSLPDGYRAVFILIEVEGYKHKEVAELLNISVGTSKSQLYHSKKLLQKKIRALDHGYER